MDNIFTLAAIEAFYNDGNDFSQILPFFVLQILKDKNFGEPILPSEIKKDLSDNFNLSVPTASINIALDKLVNKEYIKRGNDEVVLLDKGNNVSTELRKSNNLTQKEIYPIFNKLRVDRNQADYDGDLDVSHFKKFLRDNAKELETAFDAIDLFKNHPDY